MGRARRSWDMALGLFLASLAIAAGPALAQNYSDIWNNPAESGWGLTIADHETQLFAVWYTYRADGSPTWFTIPGGTFTQNRRFFNGDLYQTTGPAYNAPVFNPNAVTATKVGSAQLDFAPSGLPAGVANFTYTVGSITRTKQIQRQVFGNAPPNWGTDFTDIWYNPDEPGWGVTLAQHGNNVFGVWFTYDTNGLPLFVVMPGVTFNGSMSFTGALYTTTGPYYGNATFDPNQVRVFGAGSMTFTFQPLAAAKAFPTRGQMSGTFRNTQTFSSIVAQPFGNSSPGIAPLAMAILPLDPARPGVPYQDQAATASGGSPPYTFYGDTLANGAPPLGMGIEVNGWLTGTPSSTYTTDRSFPFGVCVRDVGGNSLCRQTSVRVLGAPQQTGTISWRIGNQCNNGEGIRYKYFDRAAGLVHPGPTSYYAIDYGETFTNTFSCVPGNQVCLGARSDSGTLSWGVGYSGTGGCTNCCGTCGNANPYGYTFGCSGQGGTSYYANWSCGSSGQCAVVMGGSAGSAGPFCSATSCNNWGQTYIPGGYSCSTTPTHSPRPGGSQCSNFP